MGDWYNPYSWFAKSDDDPAVSTDWSAPDAQGNFYGPTAFTEHDTPTSATSTANSPAANWTQYGGTSYERLRTDSPGVVDTNAQGTGADDFSQVIGGGDIRNYQYGRSATGADDAANRALVTGQQGYAHGLMASEADRANSQQAMQRDAIQGNWGQQNAALGTAASYGQQLGGLEKTQGPSGAQAQLQSGTNQAMAQQLAMARSGRGFGGNSAAMSLAQGNMAGISANQANQSAMLRAQEDAAWRGRQASNLGAAANIQAGLGQQYGQQGSADLNAGLASRSMNDTAALGWAGQGDQAYNNGMAANINGQSLANQVRGMEMSGGQTAEDNALRRWAAQNNYNLAQQQRQDQQNAALLQFGATVAAEAL